MTTAVEHLERNTGGLAMAQLGSIGLFSLSTRSQGASQVLSRNAETPWLFRLKVPVGVVERHVVCADDGNLVV